MNTAEKISLSPVSYTHLDVYKRQTGETPNIFYYPAIAGLKEWAQNGVLLDLTDSLNEDEEWKNTFLDGALDTYDLSAYGVDGIYALPNELNVDALSLIHIFLTV